MDYTYITDRVATGGGISGKADVDQLVADGITHIVDMRGEFDDATLKDPRIQSLWLPQQDDGTPRDRGQVRDGIGYTFSALTVPGAKILIHCAAGVNRGPTETYAVLRAFGIQQAEAIDRIRTKRPVVSFYNFPNYLSSVEQALLP